MHCMQAPTDEGSKDDEIPDLLISNTHAEDEEEGEGEGEGEGEREEAETTRTILGYTAE